MYANVRLILLRDEKSSNYFFTEILLPERKIGENRNLLIFLILYNKQELVPGLSLAKLEIFSAVHQRALLCQHGHTGTIFIGMSVHNVARTPAWEHSEWWIHGLQGLPAPGNHMFPDAVCGQSITTTRLLQEHCVTARAVSLCAGLNMVFLTF